MYFDERRDIRWKLAWAQRKSWGRSRRDFLIIQTFSISKKLYLKYFLPGGAILEELILRIGLAAGVYFPVLPSRWSHTGPYRPSRELFCGSTRKYRWTLPFKFLWIFEKGWAETKTGLCSSSDSPVVRRCYEGVKSLWYFGGFDLKEFRHTKFIVVGFGHIPYFFLDNWYFQFNNFWFIDVFI